MDADTNEIVQSGVIADDELSLYYGSIAVNAFGQALIGCSGSSESQFVSAYAVVGETSEGTTSFGEPILLKQGVSDYEQLDGGDINRWGDYSATVLDPSDPQTFWTIQEFVYDTDVWGTQVTAITVPEPSATLALLSALSALGVMARRRPPSWSRANAQKASMAGRPRPQASLPRRAVPRPRPSSPRSARPRCTAAG